MIIVHELVEELESYPDTTRLGRAQIDAIMALGRPSSRSVNASSMLYIKLLPHYEQIRIVGRLKRPGERYRTFASATLCWRLILSSRVLRLSGDEAWIEDGQTIGACAKG